MTTIQVKNGDGIVFNVRLLTDGEKYGRNFALTHEGEPVIEFYDTRYDHTPLGQFVSSYYLETLSDSCDKGIRTLSLQGDVNSWYIEGDSLQDIVDWAYNELIQSM